MAMTPSTKDLHGALSTVVGVKDSDAESPVALRLDDEGRLLVSVNGVVLEVDMIDVDVDAIVAPLTEILQALLGAGLPVPLAFVDPGSDAYTVAIQPGRACTRIRLIIGDSGVVVSLDDGVTESIKLPPNSMDEEGVAIAADADIKVKRYTAGVAMTDLVVEVR